MKAQIACALGRGGDKASVSALLGLLDEKLPEVRVEAVRSLAALGDDRAVEPVLARLQDEDDRVRDAAALALGRLGDRRAGEALVLALRDECARVVESAALALGTIADPARISDLIERLHETADIDDRVAYACVVALETISGKAIGLDPDRWTDWWDAVKDRPFERVDPEHEAPEGRTVPANQYYGFPIYSSRVVFVLDVSKSMETCKRLASAQAELIQVIEHLPCSTKFNIVIFSDGANAWEKELALADPAAISDAVKFVQRQSPQNKTNTWAALQIAMKDEVVDTIFFLSDGQPSVGAISDADRILAEMRAANRYRRVRIHCVALLTGEKPRRATPRRRTSSRPRRSCAAWPPTTTAILQASRPGVSHTSRHVLGEASDAFPSSCARPALRRPPPSAPHRSRRLAARRARPRSAARPGRARPPTRTDPAGKPTAAAPTP